MITINAGTKAANKKEAYAMIQSLAAGNVLLECEIQSLLLFFAPPKNAKTSTSWLAGFVADKKECREYLRYLYSDGSRLMATNGHILGWTATTLPAGYYCPKTGNAVTGMDGIRFPDIDRVIPAISSQGTEIRLDALPQEKQEDATCFLVKVETLATESPFPCDSITYKKAAFDAGLLAQCMAGGNAYLYSPIDPNSAARGFSDKGEFVIMPRRS